MADPTPHGYADFLATIKQQIRQRQYQALGAVNRELVALYWELGESISRKQKEQGWGKGVVENFARDLQAEFPGRNGFSAQNLWFMRQFYREYQDRPNLQPLVGRSRYNRHLNLRPTYFAWVQHIVYHLAPDKGLQPSGT